jgi:hypothetical protein
MTPERAAAAAPSPSGGWRSFALGLLLGLLAVGLATLLALQAVGYLQAGPTALQEPVDAVQRPAEPRPTPSWRFRDEWLTPRPKSG